MQTFDTFPKFTLKQLAYFVTAANEGTITGAAELLGVSPSAMSDAITELENQTGNKLCIRKRAQGLTLTSAGSKLIKHARKILAEAEEITNTLTTEGQEITGPITIGCYPTLAPIILPPLLQDFTKQHPRVELQIYEATQNQLTEALANGKIDIAFTYDTLVPATLQRTKLFALRAHALLPAAHPLAEKPEIKLDELIEEDLILLDAPPSSEHTLQLFKARELTPHIRHRTASYEVVRTLVARGLGYAILVSQVANPKSYEGYPLATKTITPKVPPVAIEMIWSPEHPLPPRLHALQTFAKKMRWPGAN